MIYEYECPVCKSRAEEIRSLKDRNIAPKCSDCVGEIPMKRVMSAGIFKINGFNESNGYSSCDIKKGG